MNKSRSFIFATGLPAAAAAAALEALRVIDDEPFLISQLWARRARMADGLAALGWSLQASQSPIFPLLLGSADKALQAQANLWDAGYFVPAIRPPTVPAGACRLRLTVSAAHSDAQIDGLLQALGRH